MVSLRIFTRVQIPEKPVRLVNPARPEAGFIFQAQPPGLKEKKKESLEILKGKEKEGTKDLSFVVNDKDKPKVKRIEWRPVGWHSQNYKPGFKKTAKMESKYLTKMFIW